MMEANDAGRSSPSLPRGWATSAPVVPRGGTSRISRTGAAGVPWLLVGFGGGGLFLAYAALWQGVR
ncbi:MAG: hypothetical protein AAFS07_19150, partial [Pseudomonadota bacterium]